MTIANDLGHKATKQTNCRQFCLQSLGQWDGGVRLGIYGLLV